MIEVKMQFANVEAMLVALRGLNGAGEVQVTSDSPKPLSTGAQHHVVMSEPPLVKDDSEPTPTPKPRGRPKKADAAAAPQAPAEAAPQQPSPPAESAASAPTVAVAAAKDGTTLDDVRKAAQAVVEKLGNEVGMSRARGVLVEKGGVNVIRDLKPEHYGPVVEGFKALVK